MTPRSLSSHLATLQQVMTTAVVLVFAISSLWVTKRTLEHQERDLLRAAAVRLAKYLNHEYEEEGTVERAAIAMIEEETPSDLAVEILDSTGKVLASYRRSEFQAGGDKVFAVRAVGGTTIRVSMASRAQSASLAALARALLISAVPILILTVFLSRLLARRALHPLAEMSLRAREGAIEQGVRTIGPACGFAELDELKDSFDRLLGRLDDVLQSERRFTSDASHELRTPLTVLSGELETVLADENLSPGARASLHRASEQVQTMRDLVEALLLLRIAAPDPSAKRHVFEPVNLSDVARDAVNEALSRNPGRSADVAVSAPDEVVVSGVQALISAGVRNVVDNALKFTRAGEAVRITVEEDSEACLVVDDAGLGIPPKERERVFDPFYRGAEARAEHAGLGLGLPILRRVVRAHHGEVTMESSPLGGTRVVLRLPSWEGLMT